MNKVIDGKYEIIKEAGRGGMSTVYLAADVRLKKRWALKELKLSGDLKKDEAARESFLKEAQLMKDLDYPAFPRIVDIADYGGLLYIVMDYAEGETLENILEREGALGEERALGLIRQITMAVQYLHSLNPPVVYGDIKPANIIVKKDGTVKIIDFGAAARKADAQAGSTVCLGTKGYAAPERCEGSLDERSDIFSIGVTFYRMLKGGMHTAEAARGVLWAKARHIIRKCTRRNPDERYQSCGELLYDLEWQPLKSVKRKRKRKRILLFGVLAFLLLASVFAGAFFTVRKIKLAEYERLLEENTQESCLGAIALFPENLSGYTALAELYEENGFFGPEEDAVISALYSKNSSLFDTSSAQYAYLNYRLGLMYLNFYTDEEGGPSLAFRVQKAWPFFAAVCENEDLSDDFEEAYLCGIYYRICSFYRQFVLASLQMDEARKEDYEALFETVEETLEEAGAAGGYDALSLYLAVFRLIYDRRTAMAASGFDMEAAEEILDYIYEETLKINVSRTESVQLKEEITENYAQYRKALERAKEDYEG